MEFAQMNKNKLKIAVLVAALKAGWITWFEYFERIRELEE